jgi:hypothetical protein
VINRDQAGIVASSMTSAMVMDGGLAQARARWRAGECQNAKNPPRGFADGFLSRRSDGDKNTMVDRTGQAKFGVFIHRL